MFFFLIPPEEGRERWEWLLSHLPDREMNALFQEAYRILRNKDDAEDVLQTALVIGVTKCQQVKDERKVFSWMFSIVRHEALAYHKRFHFQHGLLYARLALLKPPMERSAESRMMQEEEKARLKKAIDLLKSPGKDIVLLHLINGKTFLEISEQLKMNQNTVRSLYRRTMDRLSDMMEKLENDQEV